MRTAISLLFLSLALGTTSVACAHSRSSYDLELRCGGSACQEVTWRGNRWVVGDWGDRYTIVVRNRTDRWTEAVVTVDGRDVLNGSRGSTSNRGYLVEPYGQIEIDGWRISTQEVAAFRFTSVGDSYAGRVDGGQNAGVVGVALFPEARPRPVARKPVAPVPWPERYGYDSAPRGGAEEAAEAAPSASGDAKASRHYDAPRSQQNLGTQYGERRWSAVTEVDFKRGSSSPAAVLTVRYDDRSGLASKGVYVPPRYVEPPYVPYTPPPERFVPPPPNPFPTW
ncbi:MAG: hypothetical protein AMXMBFR64_51730 [Myxococcales bacterium]